MAIATHYKWNVYQFDVKSAFLNGVLDKEVFMEQLVGYEVKRQEKKMFKLKKALYSLKQGFRAWYEKIDGHFNKNGF